MGDPTRGSGRLGAEEARVADRPPLLARDEQSSPPYGVRGVGCLLREPKQLVWDGT